MKRILASLAMASAALGAQAHDYTTGDIRIVHPYATPTAPGVPNGAAYAVRLQNEGSQADRLVAASSPAAERVELHRMEVDAQGVMRMREVEAIEIAPGAAVVMKPGEGYHLMLLGLRQALRDGDSVPLKLRFERGGEVEVELAVQARKAGKGTDKAAGHEHAH